MLAHIYSSSSFFPCASFLLCIKTSGRCVHEYKLSAQSISDKHQSGTRKQCKKEREPGQLNRDADVSESSRGAQRNI
uniref:Secreted protein n=1 Tax=Trichogramma kaykai TaxID=54128 RepID=A0ABD2X0F0_9HYME